MPTSSPISSPIDVGLPNTPQQIKDLQTYDELQKIYQAIRALQGGLAKCGLSGYTVATLPPAFVGQRAYVTDAVAPTFMGALTGGGAVVTPVFYNGTSWIVG